MGIPFFITINHHWPSRQAKDGADLETFSMMTKGCSELGAGRSTGGAHLQQLAAARPVLDRMGKMFGRRCQKIITYIYIHMDYIMFFLNYGWNIKFVLIYGLYHVNWWHIKLYYWWLYHIIIRLEAMVKSCIIMDDIHLYYTYYIGEGSYHHRFMGN